MRIRLVNPYAQSEDPCTPARVSAVGAERQGQRSGEICSGESEDRDSFERGQP